MAFEMVPKICCCVVIGFYGFVVSRLRDQVPDWIVSVLLLAHDDAVVV